MINIKQIKIARAYKKFSQQKDNNTGEKPRYIFSIKNGQLWYNSKIIVCNMTEEIALLLSSFNWFSRITRYIGTVRMRELNKQLHKLFTDEQIQDKRERANKIAFLIDGATSHELRVGIIMDLIDNWQR